MSHKPELPVEVVKEIELRGREYAKSHGRKEIGYYALNWEAGATAYATQLHQAQQENTELRRQNDKMKEMAEGWRPLLEEVLSESGDQPLRIELIDKIKKFLYGE